MNVFSMWNSIVGYGLNDAVAIWSINVLLQATIVAAIALALGTCFRRSPAIRYGVLCCGLLLTMLSPVSVFCLQSTGLGLLTVSLDWENELPTSNNANDQLAELPHSPAPLETNIVADSSQPPSALPSSAPPSNLQFREWPTGEARNQLAVNQANSASDSQLYKPSRQWILC